MVIEKLKRGTFKHVESELYSYWDTLEEVKSLRMELISRNPWQDENVGGGRSNIPSDPTGATATPLYLLIGSWRNLKGSRERSVR